MKLNLAENIRTYRRRTNRTQEQLAERLGVSFQSVSRWENGTTVPDIELIVEMARIFGCTVDELLGCGEQSEKTSLDEICQYLEEAYDTENRDEILRLLRLIRWEYREEIDQSGDAFILKRAAYSGAYKLPGVLDEMRFLAKDFLETVHNAWVRADLITTMAMIENDGDGEEYIRLNSSGCMDLTSNSLLRERYRFRRDWERYRRADLIFRYRQLCDFLMPAEYPEAADILENRLTILRVLNSLCPDCTGADIWAGIRLRLEMKCAKRYVLNGRYEYALILLERLAERAEALASLPSGTVLPCYSPEFAALTMVHRDLRTTDGNICMTEIAAMHDTPVSPYDSTGCDMYQLWAYAQETKEPIFDPVRNHPEFIKVLERLQNAEEIQRNKPTKGETA